MRHTARTPLDHDRHARASGRKRGCAARAALRALAGLMVAVVGCPPPAPTPPDGNGPPDGSGLTAEQAAMVDDVFTQLRFAWAGLGALTGMNAVQAYLVADQPLSEDATCPRVGVSTLRGSAIADFEFDPECPDGAHGAPVIEGQVVLTIDLETSNWTGFYRFLSLEDREMNGSVRLDVSGDGLSGVSCTGTISTSTFGIGTVTGDVTFDLSPELVLTIAIGDWFAYDGTKVVKVALADVVLDLVDRSFVPQEGTLAFAVPSTDGSATEDAVVTFSAASPDTGVVSVAVGTREPVEHTLAGF